MSADITDPMSLATNALWHSIDNSTYTANFFNQQFKIDGDLPREVDEFMIPLSADLPAIEIMGARFEADWKLHRMMDNQCTFRIRVWTPEWMQSTAFQAAERVRRAIFGAPPTQGTYTDLVEQELGYIPIRVSPITYKRIMLGGPQGNRAFETTLIATLRLQDDPIDPTS